jgi:hypothetical protein
MKTLLLVLLSWVLWHSVTAQTLGRRAFVGLIVSETGSQLSVDSVLPHSMGEKAGLHKKDLIQTINNVFDAFGKNSIRKFATKFASRKR